MTDIWRDFLYLPLLNLLIFLYNTVSNNNLGIAVVWLSVIVRLILLPLSIIIERNKSIFEALAKRMQKIHQGFDKDPVQGREMIRELLHKYKINPWANVLLLGFQLLILVLLYQVFIGGIHMSRTELYPAVKVPTYIDTSFIGVFDVAKRNLTVSLIVAIILFFSLRSESKSDHSPINQKNAFFIYFFPIFTFFALYWLPSVKALFIFTSMMFSYVIHFIQKPIYETIFAKSLKKLREVNQVEVPEPAKVVEPRKSYSYVGNPLEALKKKVKK